jgi:hypothetical protein
MGETVKRSYKSEQIKFRGAAPIDPERVTNVFLFRGPVSDAGYEWLEGLDSKPRLAPCRVPGVGYRPCEPHPGLFRQFAELNSTKEDIREFARAYGDLFNSYEARQSAKRKDGTVAFGATLGTWRQEIGDMRVLVNLWDQIKADPPQTTELKKIIRRTDKALGYVIVTPKGTSDETLAHADIPGVGLERFAPDDVLLPARFALQREVNKRIAEFPTVPWLAWTPDYHQRIIFEPSNLLAAMWIQFAEAMTGAFRLVRCAGDCGRYIQVGPGAKRAHTATCGSTCRQRKRRNPGNLLR